MSRANDLLALDRRHLWHPFTQARTAPDPMVAVAAAGAHIITADGRRVLDLVSSWWVNLHGHGHPVIAAAIARQAAAMEQVIFADFTHEPAVRLAAGLAELLPGDLNRVFFSDDGSTAVEVALKIALQYFANTGQDRRTRLLAFDGGYHGDTVGAMSVGRSSGYFRAWEGMLFPVTCLPWPESWIGDDAADAKEQAALEALEAALDGGDVAAVILEPLLQGASGMRQCRPGFVAAVTRKVQESGALVIFDEVMTGFGRTGDLFACLTAGVVPDLVCLSKGLTGGFLAMGATVCRDTLYDAFLGDSLAQAFLHGHSYTANPLGCTAGVASLALLTDPACTAQRQRIAQSHRDRLTRYSPAFRPRLQGTIAALSLGDGGYGAKIGQDAKRWFLDRGILVRPLGTTLYFLPPYCIEESDLQRAWDALDGFISQLPAAGA